MKSDTIKLIIAHGSRVKGGVNEASDYDFGYLSTKPLTLIEKGELTSSIATKHNINEDKIDIVDLKDANPILKYEVAKHGRLDEGTIFDFTRFRVLAWKEYLDTARFRKAREEMFAKNV